MFQWEKFSKSVLEGKINIDESFNIINKSLKNISVWDGVIDLEIKTNKKHIKKLLNEDVLIFRSNINNYTIKILACTIDILNCVKIKKR